MNARDDSGQSAMLPPWLDAEGDGQCRVFDSQSSRALDQAASHRYGIPGIILMENAARGLAHVAESEFLSASNERKITIICGRGNNGGDGYALARRLHNAGARVMLITLGEPREGSDARTNHDICRKMKLTFIEARAWLDSDDESRPDLIVDAVLGTGLDRTVEGLPAEVIGRLNAATAPTLAVDAPSGLDCDTGQPLGQAVRATRTVTFVGFKQGFLQPGAAPYVGRVTVASIGVPRELIEGFGMSVEEALASTE